MKKNILFFVAMIFLFGIFPSCSKDESSLNGSKTMNSAISRESQSDQALDSLIIAIDEYNAAFSNENRYVASQLFSVAPNSNTQRGFWGIVKKICKVIVADASGAAAGSVGGGVGSILAGGAASTIAVIDQFGLDSIKSLALPATCPFLSSQETGSITGEAHNKVVYQVIKSNPNFATMSDIELYNAITFAYQKQYGKTNALPSVAVVSNILNSVRTHLLENDLNDNESWYTACQQITQAPPKINKLIVDFILNIAYIREYSDMRSYTIGYAQIVRSSKISDDQKSLIFDGTSVAANSCALWNACISSEE